MKIEVRKEQIKERKADDQGRISLPASKYAGKELEVAILGELDEDEGREANTKVHCGGCGEQYETFEEAKECDCEKLDIEKGDNK